MKNLKLTANIKVETDLIGIDKSLLNSFLNCLNCINILFQIGKDEKIFPSSENYFFNKIIDILNKGYLNLDHNSKTEIASQIKQISNGIYDMGSISYKFPEKEQIELIFGKVYSPDNNNKKLYGAVLGLVDMELGEYTEKFDNLSQKIYEEFKFNSGRFFFEVKSEFRCMNVVSFAGELARKEKPISVFYSGDTYKNISSLSKVAVFSNIYLERFKIISEELGRKFINDFKVPDDRTLKKILICWLRGHDLGHSFGADNLRHKMKKNRKEYYILHELKSDIVSLFLLKRITKELFNKDILFEVFSVFVAEMFRYIRRGNIYKLPDSGSAYLAYKYLSEFEALESNKSDEKFSVNIEKFDGFVETFSKELINLFAAGSREEALKIVDKWGKIQNLDSEKLPDELTFLDDQSIPYYIDLEN